MTQVVLARLQLPAHPESFQLDPAGASIYVNLPGAHRIAIVDRSSGKTTGSLPAGLALANYPMALDVRSRRLAVVFRAPAELAVFDLVSGSAAGRLTVCGDADDVFFDKGRNQIYVVCGQGLVDIVGWQAGTMARFARIPTARGARTGLWSPISDRLYGAAPATSRAAAAVLVLKPSS